MKILDNYKNYVPKTVIGIILQKFIFSTKLKLFTGLILLLISAIIIRIIFGDDYPEYAYWIMIACFSPTAYASLKLIYYAFKNILVKK